MKTILITGSTDGIGKLVAIQLANEGHQIYMHGRNTQKLDAVIAEVKSTSNNEHVKGFLADFSDLESVKKMAGQINQELTNIDVLINNAGIFNSPVSSSKNGMDIRMVVNYLAPYLLTKTILPLLEKSNFSRVINLSSAAQAPVSLSALKGHEQLSVQEAYAQSKLALTMWSFDLAKKLISTSVIAVNPGSLLNTKMAIEAYGQHWSPADKGADILHDLAVAEEYNEMTGMYFDNDKGAFSSAHADAYQQEKIDQLIAVTESILMN